MSLKRPRHSRWSRLPATFRSGEKRPGSENDLERLTLYLPPEVLERAESQAREAGYETVQLYCEALLRDAIDRIEAPRAAVSREPRSIPETWVEEIASEAALLMDWNRPRPIGELEIPAVPRPAHTEDSPMRPNSLGSAKVDRPRDDPPRNEGPRPVPSGNHALTMDSAAMIVLRHAAIAGEDPAGLIGCLRRGEPIEPGAAQELLQALIDLESDLQQATVLDRRLAFALHRLAFEGQVLLTDAWPGMAPDPALVETLRLVQEGVDRVLSGEDIRYYREDDEEIELSDDVADDSSI